ncbi:hypothetical protein [Inediibacterium massiliense]|uniref:hypothetical protein n=1 Tax=Inediibacterium massiliense TaxID=1658111 RepID=UPI0006B51319|nr:hypothetical protein [Inediibacterium massiliense]
MKTMDFVKVLKLSQRNLDRAKKVVNITDENITKQSTYNFLINALETYKGEKFKNNELITEFLKINLPKDEDKARDQWFNGIEYEGNNYIAWFATVGGMKNEDNTRRYEGICETIFIREDYQGFSELVENLISLGKFAEIEKLDDADPKKIICINKDVLSRLSLITSDLIAEIDMPNFIVLPQATYHIVKDYKTVEPFTHQVKNEDGEMIDKIDYNLVDVHFDDDIDVFDGGGIATPKVFESIGKQLNRNDIEFSIIRAYGIAVKGLITKFDIIEYLDYMYKGDTEFCRKTDKGYELLDRWKDWQPVTDNTILLNDSMVKLAKYFDNMQEYRDRMEKLNKRQYRKYGALLNKLYITKVNKPDKEIKDYRRTNYQLINVLALTINNYKELVKQDLKLFRKILKPYDCIKDTKEFVINTDYINIFYKNCVGEDLSEEQDDFEEKLNESCENVVEKVDELININPEFVKLNYVKMNLKKLIEKKVREFACGKVTVKAKFQYIAVDPISYMNFAITRDQGKNGLDAGQFYSYDCNDEDIRTISRNPLSAYSEVHNVSFVKNEFLDRWLSDCKELVYFNQKSDILSLLSSADCDGDGITQIDNEIIRNAVVKPQDGKYFITKNDGEKVSLIYNKENRFISTFRASGNLIGRIALKAANINSDAQHIPDYYNTVENKFVDWVEIRDQLEGKNEKVNEHIDEQKENGIFMNSWSMEDKLKQYIKNRFYDNEKEIYICLYNSMCAIDAPKTLKFLSKEYMEVIDNKYDRKVNFLQYKENKEDVRKREYYHSSNALLDRFSDYVKRHLLNIINNSKTQFKKREDILQKFLDNEEFCQETYELCKAEIEKLYIDYNAEREEAEKICKEQDKKDWEYKRDKSRFDIWTDTDERDYQLCLKLNKQKKYDSYKEIDKKYILVANQIVKTFDKETICKTISNMKKMTENFILSLFFTCLKTEGTRCRYQKCNNGDIEYLYERYRKIKKEGFDNSKVVDRIATEDKIRLKLEQKVRFRMTDESIIGEIREGLKDGAYELNLKDERIEAFEDFTDLLKDRKNITIVGFHLKKDGTESINKKNFGVMARV